VTVSISSFFSRSFRPALGLLALLAALALPSAVLAQDQPDAQADKDKKEFSDKVRDGIAKFGPLQAESKWDEALTLINDLLKSAAPDSYDEFMLNYIKAQLYLRIEQTPKAIEPYQTALRISDQHQFFDDKDERAALKTLAQIYYGEASAKGVPALQQDEYFTKAAMYLKRLLEKERGARNLNSDDVLFYAYLLVQRAQTNPENPNLTMLKEAQNLSQEGLLLTATPKPEFYRLLLSTLLAENDFAGAAEVIELLLQKDPANKDSWTQLSAIYLNLGADDRNKEKAMENNLRAILTFERAQAIGLLKTPKDNYNLVGTYANIGQTLRAAQLLETGLKSGAIDSDKNKWLYLSTWYQQLNKEQKAIETLKEAAKHFPDSGEFDFMAAQNYYGLEKYADALQEARVAADKGLGDKTWQVWSFIAYAAFELGKYEDAVEAADKALGYPASKKDAQLPGVKEAAEKAIADRAAQAEALKAKQQQ
jgi:predicted Zn-dependent protease